MRVILANPPPKGVPFIPCANVATALHYVENEPEAKVWTSSESHKNAPWYVVNGSSSLD